MSQDFSRGISPLDAMLAAFLLSAPFWLPTYFLSQFTFVGIYAIACLGLMLSVGFCGQVSMGHAAFLGLAAYTEVYLQSRGWPFLLSLPVAVAMAAGLGVLIGLPALRVRGMYLSIATLAFGFIVEEVLVRAEGFTGGNRGLTASTLAIFGVGFQQEERFHYLVWIAASMCAWMATNLLRSPTGRAWLLLRDSEILAQSLGVDVARYKTLAFMLSAAMTGLAGVLYAHELRFLSPDQFTVMQSIELLMMIVIGGLGSVRGAVLGALFWIAMQQAIALLKDVLPTALAQQAGLPPTIFGLILMGFVLFEPRGLQGLWLRLLAWMRGEPQPPRRARAYARSERLR